MSVLSGHDEPSGGGSRESDCDEGAALKGEGAGGGDRINVVGTMIRRSEVDCPANPLSWPATSQ